MSISVLILTYNEEVNLPGCLDSVAVCDDVWVLDSYSQDATARIARERGVNLRERGFDHYAAQRNHGLAFPFKHDWVLMLDADERVPPELWAEMKALACADNPVTLYQMRRKDMFMGRWLKRSSGYPTWFGRFFRVGRVRVEREINEEYYTDGQVGQLDGHLIHYPFNKGISYWYERHNRYSDMEARRLLEERGAGVPWRYFWHKDPMLRRKAFKQFAYRMPFRPLGAFLFLYVLKGGFLDGRGGFCFSVMRATYEFMINLKIRELETGEPRNHG